MRADADADADADPAQVAQPKAERNNTAALVHITSVAYSHLPTSVYSMPRSLDLGHSRFNLTAPPALGICAVA